ncbi:hypothetical protein RJT34_16422 [Clitoria ternatea]|uniref:Uncharacterized protein n=1 Tax=Clitoria ternatea TaxID=43366 RepID=A0AAN9PDN1_CLITE
MFSNSQFDPTSAFSGGGFTASQPSQINDSSPAPSKGLVPVTVKQISEASQSRGEKSNFVINGVDLNNVTLVGMVFEKAERNTDVIFVLDDGTGRMKCIRWVNETFDTREMEAVTNGIYVRVYGHLKSFQGVGQLVAFSVRYTVISTFLGGFSLAPWQVEEEGLGQVQGVRLAVPELTPKLAQQLTSLYWLTAQMLRQCRISLGLGRIQYVLLIIDCLGPVTNFDEIAFHFIDCIHNHLRTKLKMEGITSANPSSDPSFNTPVKNASNGSQAPSNPVYAQYSVDGLKDCDKLVIDYLQQHSDMSDERGIHVDELSRELKLPLDKIMLSLKTLGDDGLVYSTIDDYHYKNA